jgi:hypothetical protein
MRATSERAGNNRSPKGTGFEISCRVGVAAVYIEGEFQDESVRYAEGKI